MSVVTLERYVQRTVVLPQGASEDKVHTPPGHGCLGLPQERQRQVLDYLAAQLRDCADHQ